MASEAADAFMSAASAFMAAWDATPAAPPADGEAAATEAPEPAADEAAAAEGLDDIDGDEEMGAPLEEMGDGTCEDEAEEPDGTLYIDDTSEVDAEPVDLVELAEPEIEDDGTMAPPVEPDGQSGASSGGQSGQSAESLAISVGGASSGSRGSSDPRRTGPYVWR